MWGGFGTSPCVCWGGGAGRVDDVPKRSEKHTTRVTTLGLPLMKATISFWVIAIWTTAWERDDTRFIAVAATDLHSDRQGV